MDPDETLRMIRHYVALLNNAAGMRTAIMAECGENLAEYVEAMDEWLSKGGFLPKEWDHP